MRSMPAPARRVLAICAAALVLGAATPSVRGAEEAVPRPPCWYLVRPGDSLTGIARKFYGSHEHWRKIEAANPGVDWRRLKIGQRLFIPALDSRPAAEAPPEPSPAPARSAPEKPPSGSQAQAESAPPERFALLAGSALASIVGATLAFPASFLVGSLLLWWASRLLRWRMRLADASFRKAALATLLCYLLGGLMFGLAAGAGALVFLTGMDSATAGLAWRALTVVLGFPAILWVHCRVLAGVYRTRLLGGLGLLLVWIALELAAGCLLCALPLGIFALITGGMLAGAA